MMMSTDRGVTWKTVVYNNEPATYSDERFTSKISADATGTRMLTVMDGHKLVKSSDGGSTWVGVDNVPISAQANYNGYASVISGNGAVWYAVNDVQDLYVSKDTGSTWTRRNVTKTDPTEWRDFVTDSTGAILYAHTYTQFYVSTDYGVTLTLVFSFPKGTGLNNYIDDITCDPAGKYAYVLATDGLYVYTRATGAFVKNANLKLVENQGYSAYSVATSSSGQHLLVSVQPYGLFNSDDYGNTWVQTK